MSYTPSVVSCMVKLMFTHLISTAYCIRPQYFHSHIQLYNVEILYYTHVEIYMATITVCESVRYLYHVHCTS